jgi:hypothetical protein
MNLRENSNGKVGDYYVVQGDMSGDCFPRLRRDRNDEAHMGMGGVLKGR